MLRVTGTKDCRGEFVGVRLSESSAVEEYASLLVGWREEEPQAKLRERNVVRAKSGLDAVIALRDGLPRRRSMGRPDAKECDIDRCREPRNSH